MSGGEFLSMVQVFLLAMIVIGMAIKEVSQETQNDRAGSDGFTMFVGLMVGWIVVTALVLAALIAIVIAGTWLFAFVYGALAGN